MPIAGGAKVDTPLSYLEALAEQAHPEGGWGYAPGQAPQLEPTCLGLLALALQAREALTATKPIERKGR